MDKFLIQVDDQAFLAHPFEEDSKMNYDVIVPLKVTFSPDAYGNISPTMVSIASDSDLLSRIANCIESYHL